MNKNIDPVSGRYLFSWILKGVSVKELEVAHQISDLDNLQDDESLLMIEHLLNENKLAPHTQRFLLKSAVAHKKHRLIKLYFRLGFDKNNEIEFDFNFTNHDVRPVILFGQTPPLISAITVENADLANVKFLVEQGCRLDTFGMFYFGG